MNPKRPLYFDYMATTPVDPEVACLMQQYLSVEGVYGNPASLTHFYGQEASQAVENARQQIADSVHANPESIVFTSGATEANNLAIIGAARFYCRKGKHLITLKTEHKSVLESFKQLEREGFQVTYLTPQSNGLLSLDVLREALRVDTILVSIMHVNNEIGVIQDIQAIGELLHNKGILFHVDAAQSAGKLALNLTQLPVQLMAFSAHKNYGPKGIGALYVQSKPRIRLQPLTFGGGQEGGLRSGTLATHQIVGMGAAFARSEKLREEEQARILSLRDVLWAGISTIPGINMNGDPLRRIAGNLNFSVAGVRGDTLLIALHELALSTTSACIAARQQPSAVLKALGLSDALALSAIRLSLGRFTTLEEVQQAIDIIHQQIPALRLMV